jgi:uncharacterized PurR-regulated membrane protein YhhQ (DUF165 family)
VSYIIKCRPGLQLWRNRKLNLNFFNFLLKSKKKPHFLNREWSSRTFSYTLKSRILFFKCIWIRAQWNTYAFESCFNWVYFQFIWKSNYKIMTQFLFKKGNDFWRKLRKSSFGIFSIFFIQLFVSQDLHS